MFDFGELTYVYSSRLSLLLPTPPLPPGPPPEPPPGRPPSSPPPPPPPELVDTRPSPPTSAPPPTSTPPCLSSDSDSCTFGAVMYTADGVCDDGGDSSSYSTCALGTDATDCPSRCAADVRRRLDESNELLEIWVSRSLATFGSRAAVVRMPADAASGTRSITVRTHEALEDDAYGRYAYVRSFASETKLRIDGCAFFAISDDDERRRHRRRRAVDANETGADAVVDGDSARKANHTAQTEETDPQKHSEGRRYAEVFDDEEGQTADAERAEADDDERGRGHQTSVSPSVLALLASTRRVCELRTAATDARRVAAQIRRARLSAANDWARLNERERDFDACTDCFTGLPSDCTFWFAVNHAAYASDDDRPGAHSDANGEAARRARRLREELASEEHTRQRRRALEEFFDESCCRTNLRTGERECDRKHCNAAFSHLARPRMAHVLRRMHEGPGEVSLSVAQLVATDMLGPHLHSDPRCRTDASRRSLGELECVASSLSTHVAERHGISRERVDRELDRYGLSLSKLFTAQLRHETSGKGDHRSEGGGATRPRSAAKTKEKLTSEGKLLQRVLRRDERGRSGDGDTKLPSKVERRVPAPRASWLAESTASAKRARRSLSDDVGADATVRTSVAPSGATHVLLSDAHEWMHNQSRAAKRIVRAANDAAARTASRPLAVKDVVTASFAAAVTSDLSMVGRARTVVTALGRVAEHANTLSGVVRGALSSSAEATPRSTRREPTAHVERILSEVDRAHANGASVRSRGFDLPPDHEASYGWVATYADWNYWLDEVVRVGRALAIREKGGQAQTGYALLDVPVPRSVLGDALRGYPRSSLEGSYGGGGGEDAPLLRSLAHVVVANDDQQMAQATERVARALRQNDHRTHVRRILESGAYVGERTVRTTTYYAKQLFDDSVKTVPYRVPTWTVSKDLREFGRWLVYDVALCYLYPPPSSKGDEFGDGTRIRLHYGRRACFPTIPFLPPEMRTFNERYSLREDFRWSSLEYKHACNSDSVRSLLRGADALQSMTVFHFALRPYGSLLRLAEGLDSLDNLARSSDPNATDMQRATALTCGVAQLGGVLWMAIVVVWIALFCVCAPVGTYCCVSFGRLLFRCCFCRFGGRSRRQET